MIDDLYDQLFYLSFKESREFCELRDRLLFFSCSVLALNLSEGSLALIIMLPRSGIFLLDEFCSRKPFFSELTCFNEERA